MKNQQVLKPIKRNYLSQHLGKEYFILRRRLHYLFNDNSESQIGEEEVFLQIHPF